MSAITRVRRVVFGRELSTQEASSEEITPVEGLSALSLDALTSVAYGPEAILIVLATAGATALHLILPITIGIVALLVILVVSYRQVIDAYPRGGGAYAVSRDNFGPRVAKVAGAALIVDYTLTVAVSIAAGVGQLTSAFPATAPYTVPMCLGILLVITGLNLRGLGEGARAFLIPTLVFIVGLLAVIAVGLVHPLGPQGAVAGRSLVVSHSLQAVSVLLVLKAFSAGCSALTGVEAIANGVPLFKEPRVARAKRTELLLGVILAVMLLGLAVLVDKIPHPAPGEPDGAEPGHGGRRRAQLGLLRRLARPSPWYWPWPPTPRLAACRCPRTCCRGTTPSPTSSGSGTAGWSSGTGSGPWPSRRQSSWWRWAATRTP